VRASTPPLARPPERAVGRPWVLGQRALPCLCGALAWAGPRALGLEDAPSVGALGYLALVGCGLLSLLLATLAWEAGGPSTVSSSSSDWGPALSLGLGLALIPWSALGYWVLTQTHNRPLGAVTFAAGAVLSAIPCIFVARWCLRLRLRHPRRGAVLVAACAALALLVAGACVVTAGSAALADAALQLGLLELLLGVALAAAILALPAPLWAGRARRHAVPVCVAVGLATLWLLRSDTEVRATVKSAPVIAGIVGLAIR
jgi:hypothetical protein